MSFSKMVWYVASAMLLTMSSTAHASLTVSSRFIEDISKRKRLS